MSHVRRGGLLLAILIIASCSSGTSQSPSMSGGPASSEPSPSAAVAATPPPTPSPNAAATPTPSAPATPSAGPTSFTSATYGYSVTLPAGWTVTPASAKWDGKASLSSDSAEVDQFIGPSSATATGVGAPYGKKLADYVTELIAWNYKYHGDTCPTKPESQTPIKVGGVAGVLVQWNCGILINSAVTVRNGVAYQFLFRDQAIQAASDPADKATFLSLLGSVKFPT
jgi:hypothetical protein